MRVAVLAEQNFNLIDGSTIWLLNVCKLLALQEDLDVTLVLTHPLTAPVLAHELPDSIKRIDPVGIAALGGPEGPLAPETLSRALTAIEAAPEHGGRFDRLFARGTSFIEALLADPGCRTRLVGYAPGAIPDPTETEPVWIGRGRAARMPLVVQSEIAKHALESLSDYPGNVVHVVPPIVFVETGEAVAETRDPARPATLCYSGKIDPQYGLDWLVEFGRGLAGRPGLGLDIIAGKDTWRSRHKAFFSEMDAFRDEIRAGAVPNASLASGLPHAEAKARMGRADFAWCLRHTHYDDVIEISTKIVEFCTLGVPPILNDTALNRSLFGADYPYLVDIAREDPVARTAELMETRDGAAYAAARVRIGEIAAHFAPGPLADRLGRAIRGHKAGAPPLTDRPRRLLIATHERKFLMGFLDRVAADGQVSIRWQDWASTVKPAGSLQVPEDVDTVFCEWCCENAVWHSRNKRAGTRLIVRLHRFEAFRDFPERVDWEAVDALIVVSDHFRNLMVERHGVDPARIHVMPQYIDWAELRRPKTPQARFTLGLVGINPFGHKRFDRAIDFFAALHARDPRFTLAVRSVMPWQIAWVWDNRPEERAAFEAVFKRIFADPDLSAAIRFDPAGPDMAQWYREVGTILSSSDSEGCHTAVIEGMASGCYPVVYDWPGARGLFGDYVHAEMTDAIDAVISFADRPDQKPAREAIARKVEGWDTGMFTEAVFQIQN